MRRCAASAALIAGLAGCSRGAIDAVQDGPEAVRAALEAGANPDERDADGNTILHLAAFRKDPEILRVALAHGAKVDITNGARMTALGIAADNGCLACALVVLDAHADPNAAQGAPPERALERAAAKGWPDMVRLLLEFGADPNLAGADGETPLHAATRADPYRAAAVTKLLVDDGADPRAADVLGETPLHKAAERDSTEVIAFYASRGVDLDAPNAWGATALDRAVEGRHDRAADELYRLGGHVALTKGFEPPLVAAARVDDASRARWLLASGVDPHETFEGKSLLDIARENGSREVGALLVAAGARR